MEPFPSDQPTTLARPDPPLTRAGVRPLRSFPVANMLAIEGTATISVQAKRWTREEFERLAELGLLAPDSHVQLIGGEIFEMPPPGAPHSTAVGLVLEALRAAFQETACHIRVQQPVLIGSHSEPEPDVTVVRGGILNYRETHPAALDVALVVEVADSSIDLDRRRKVRLYGRAGIPEYWIIVLLEKVVEVFTDPGPAGYRQRAVLRQGDTVRPIAKPDAAIQVTSLLP